MTLTERKQWVQGQIEIFNKNYEWFYVEFFTLSQEIKKLQKQGLDSISEVRLADLLKRYKYIENRIALEDRIANKLKFELYKLNLHAELDKEQRVMKRRHKQRRSDVK